MPVTAHFRIRAEIFVERFEARERAKTVRALPVLEGPDPFGIAHSCSNAGGHVVISSGEDIVCFHCSRIFSS